MRYASTELAWLLFVRIQNNYSEQYANVLQFLICLSVHILLKEMGLHLIAYPTSWVLSFVFMCLVRRAGRFLDSSFIKGRSLISHLLGPFFPLLCCDRQAAAEVVYDGFWSSNLRGTPGSTFALLGDFQHQIKAQMKNG